MHLRFSSCIGMSVSDEETGHVLGRISGILLHPDSGKVEGFFVMVKSMLRAEELFLASADIRRWGMAVQIRDAAVLSPVQDRVRLLPLLEEDRVFLGRSIRTESGERLGTCKDVQFDTLHFLLEWIWPKTLWFWGVPIALGDIVEVRRDAIIVRDQLRPVTDEAKETVEPTGFIPAAPDPA